jgi:hypothetical protein
LSNHLGNVLVTVSDRVLPVVNPNAVAQTLYYSADVKSASDYSAFGAPLSGRISNASTYRYGMNGQEKDEELGSGVTTAEYWEYDAKLGRRWNVDPIVKPWQSGYSAFDNCPVVIADPHGDTGENGTAPAEGETTDPPSTSTPTAPNFTPAIYSLTNNTTRDPEALRQTLTDALTAAQVPAEMITSTVDGIVQLYKDGKLLAGGATTATISLYKQTGTDPSKEYESSSITVTITLGSDGAFVAVGPGNAGVNYGVSQSSTTGTNETETFKGSLNITLEPKVQAGPVKASGASASLGGEYSYVIQNINTQTNTTQGGSSSNVTGTQYQGNLQIKASVVYYHYKSHLTLTGNVTYERLPTDGLGPRTPVPVPGTKYVVTSQYGISTRFSVPRPLTGMSGAMPVITFVDPRYYQPTKK